MSSDDRRASSKTSRISDKHSRSRDSRLSKANGNKMRPSFIRLDQTDVAPARDAIAAPEIGEIEAAIQQGREEERRAREIEAAIQQGRNEERRARVEDEIARQREEEQNALATAKRDKKRQKNKCMLAAFVFILITGGVVAWMLVSDADSSNPKDLSQNVTVLAPTTEQSGAPSSSPSIQEEADNVPNDSGPQSQTTCAAIRNSTLVSGQEDLAVQEYDILMDVMLDSETRDLSPLTIELQDKIQRFLLPSLAGCSMERRRLQIELYIINALVNAEVNIGPSCLDDDSSSPCHLYAIHLDIYVQRTVSSADFSKDILEKFQEAPLVERLGLLTPFQNITVVNISSAADDSAHPSMTPSTVPPTESPSVNSSRAPVTFPTTEAPTKATTIAPSIKPTLVTTTEPTKAPTQIPTKAPTPIPTPGPTQAPTPVVSESPTTAKPTITGSGNPTTEPSASPSLVPTPVPSPQPSKSPTNQPSFAATFPCIETKTELSTAISQWEVLFTRLLVEAQYGPIRGWCFGPLVTEMNDLFTGYSSFNTDISSWDVSRVTAMRNMFENTQFNQDLSSWDVSSVNDMYGMFANSPFNGNISSWDVSSVRNMNHMFLDAPDFNQDLSSWDVSNVRVMILMFQSASSFNQDLSSWDVSLVLDMRHMFKDASSFNQNLSSWDVSRVNMMNSMFYGASSFNGDITSWDVSNVRDMTWMFYQATAFNQDISNWEVSLVTKIPSMFNGASSFNQDLSSWDVSSIIDAKTLFGNSAFSQDLCAWSSRIPITAGVDGMFDGSTCPDESDPNLDRTIGIVPGPFCHVCQPNTSR
ncbi:MAG: hypothetical protein SGBAC_006941 [Bacillariaceae sp.]